MRSKKIMQTLCLLATVALVATGCNLSINDSDAGTSTEEDAQCSITMDAETCNSCMESSCCDEAKTCGAATGGSCLDLNDCLMLCTEDEWDTCSQTCGDEFPDGLVSYNGLMNCLSAQCDAACNGSATTDPEPPTDTVEPPTDTVVQPTDTVVQPTDTVVQPTDTVVQPTDTVVQPTDTVEQPTDTEPTTDEPKCGFTAEAVCQTCVEGACCESALACTNSDACFAIMDCVYKCVDETCQDACLTASPGGVEAFTTFMTCTGVSCADECFAG